MADRNSDFLRQLLVTFQGEARDHLQSIVSTLVLLEQAEGSARQSLVDRILKRLHTLKGAARAVELGDLEALCHAMEDVFSSTMLSGHALAPGQLDMIHSAAGLAQSLTGVPTGRLRNQAAAMQTQLRGLAVELNGTNDTIGRRPDAVPPLRSEAYAKTHDQSLAGNPAFAVRDDLISVAGTSLDRIHYQAESLLDTELGLRHQIDELLDMAEDMAQQHNDMQTVAYLATVEHRCRSVALALGTLHRNFAQSRTKLMEATLETALVPFHMLIDQFPALVRNLARSYTKEAVLTFEGGGIRVDRRILTVIKDALVHLLTNAVDHGIEGLEVRRQAGKPTTGKVHILVEHLSGNQVAVSVTDDGCGMDIDGLIEAAVRTGELSQEHVVELSDHEKFGLALRGGVSTSAQVTQVSGRGVGLAVVADSVSSIGGRISIDSTPGTGTCFRLVLPMRLSTLSGLVVRVGPLKCIIPLADVGSVRALQKGDIQTVENRPTLLLDRTVIPALSLRPLLGLEHSGDPSGNDVIAVIAYSGKAALAILVDEIVSEQEVLPKGLGKQLRRVRYVSGAAQLGDGSLVLILALEDIFRHSPAWLAPVAPQASESQNIDAAKRLLVVEDSITSRLLLKHILIGSGYEVDTAVDGMDALSKLRRSSFDGVVSDIEMPRLDGLELTARIRNNPDTEALPVVLVTSLQSADERERGLHAGADAYIVKAAFDQDNLLTTLRRLI